MTDLTTTCPACGACLAIRVTYGWDGNPAIFHTGEAFRQHSHECSKKEKK